MSDGLQPTVLTFSYVCVCAMSVSVGVDLPKMCLHDLDMRVLPIFDFVKIILVLLIQIPQGI